MKEGGGGGGLSQQVFYRKGQSRWNPVPTYPDMTPTLSLIPAPVISVQLVHAGLASGLQCFSVRGSAGKWGNYPRLAADTARKRFLFRQSTYQLSLRSRVMTACLGHSLISSCCSAFQATCSTGWFRPTVCVCVRVREWVCVQVCVDGVGGGGGCLCVCVCVWVYVQVCVDGCGGGGVVFAVCVFYDNWDFFSTNMTTHKNVA